MNELALFNSLFDDGVFGFSMPELTTKNYGMPRVDVKENKDSYTVDMDLPGRSEDEVNVSIKDKVLTISSAKEEKSEKKENGQWLIRERRSASFTRSFTLPEDVDVDAVAATFKNGVLSVNMPRTKAVNESKKIAITAA